MEEWKTYKLGELLNIKYGKDHKSLSDGLFPAYGSGGIMRMVEKPIYDKPSILIPRKGSLNNIIYTDSPFWTVDTMFWTIINKDIVLPHYLYYSLKDIDFASLNVGSAVPSLTCPIIEAIEVTIPSISIQQKILNCIEPIDEKISLNNRINDNLEQQAKALYKSWFVDFEPFKDGEFIESEAGMIPKGWRVGNLLDVAELYDSKRKPLSGMQRSAMKKIYPYYGATSIMDYVDNYIFDGIYLLMGEDGSVVTDEGYPYLQYVSGKFWPNNHAHVMQGKNGYSTEMLHCFLFKKNISEIVTGAVQAKISQGNMKKISLIIAPDAILNEFTKILDAIYAKIRGISSENLKLEIMRGSLLPKLMSGELKINEIDC